MSPLQTVRRTLDDLYSDVEAANPQRADSRITQAFRQLSNSYFAVGAANRARPDYTEAATRFAYGYKYVGCHAYVLRRVLEKLPTPLFLSEESLNITCLGGGPGSDVIGVLDFISLSASDAVEEVKFSIFDKEPGWRRNIAILEARGGFDLEVEISFDDFDATGAPTKALKHALEESDLVTVSFLVSELLEIDCSRFWDALFGRVPSGCLVAISDIGNDDVRDLLVEFESRAELETLVCGHKEGFRTTGNASMLDPYCTRLDHRPKLNSETSYAVFRKR